MSERILSVRIPLALARKVDALAMTLARPRDWIVRQALTAWMDKEEEHERLTREALADVDAGRVVSHAVVKTWADGLLKLRRR